jgi:hypothetical protein
MKEVNITMVNKEEIIPFDFSKDEMSNKLVRINISKYYYDKLTDIIKKYGDDDLFEAIEAKKTIVQDFNINKTIAVEKATEARTARAKKDIKLAFEYLERNNKKITQKAIAEASKCSVNTCRKYDYIWKK